MSDLISREAAIAAATSCPDRYYGSWVAECLHALPAVQPDAALAWRIAVEMEVHAALGTTTKAKADAILALLLLLSTPAEGQQP